MDPCGPLCISAITGNQQGGGWSLSSCCEGSHASISSAGCLWFLVNKYYWATVIAHTLPLPGHGVTQQPVMAVGRSIPLLLQSAFLLIYSEQPLGMFPCILLSLNQIPTVPLHSAFYLISSPTFTLVHICRFPFASFLQTSIQTCSVITSRQVCIQPHAVFFSSLYSYPIPLPDNFCIVSCHKYYFQHCYCNLQEPRVIPDVFGSMHISLSFLVLHWQAPLVFSGLHIFMDLMNFAHIISVFSSLLSWRNSKPCSISRNIKKSHHFSIHTDQAHVQQCCKYLS